MYLVQEQCLRVKCTNQDLLIGAVHKSHGDLLHAERITTNRHARRTLVFCSSSATVLPRNVLLQACNGDS